MKERLQRLWAMAVSKILPLFWSRKFRRALREAFISTVIYTVTGIAYKEDYTPQRLSTAILNAILKVMRNLRMDERHVEYVEVLVRPVINDLVQRYYENRLLLVTELEAYLRKIV